ncbi:sensor histidine kinase [Agaribacterium sp. ZY112]|uniref:sensor histidine kinase n=1 Tax=Agaribacterium sp. ZY112 TaxID=3233574 RepID=UPI0035246DC5
MYENIKRNWLLNFSGFVAWLLVSFLVLKNLDLNSVFVVRAFAFLLFFVCFSLLVSSNQGENISRNKALIVLELVLVLFLLTNDQFQFSAILFVLIAAQLPIVLNRKQALLSIAAISLAHLVVLYVFHEADALFSVLLYLVLQLFGYSTLELALREARAKEELSLLNQELLATRFILKETSKRQERLRISRDLHDVIGHQLTALSLNLEVASHKVAPEHKALLQDNVLLARDLLNDVRKVVKEIRDEEQFDLYERLMALVDQLPSLELVVVSKVEIKSSVLNQQLLCCLQEGISNALRHGAASNLSLSCEKNGTHIKLELLDDGSGLNLDNELALGSGLRGMNERLARFNGEAKLCSESKQGCLLRLQAEDSYD